MSDAEVPLAMVLRDFVKDFMEAQLPEPIAKRLLEDVRRSLPEVLRTNLEFFNHLLEQHQKQKQSREEEERKVAAALSTENIGHNNALARPQSRQRVPSSHGTRPQQQQQQQQHSPPSRLKVNSLAASSGTGPVSPHLKYSERRGDNSNNAGSPLNQYMLERERDAAVRSASRSGSRQGQRPASSQGGDTSERPQSRPYSRSGEAARVGASVIEQNHDQRQKYSPRDQKQQSSPRRPIKDPMKLGTLEGSSVKIGQGYDPFVDSSGRSRQNMTSYEQQARAVVDNRAYNTNYGVYNHGQRHRSSQHISQVFNRTYGEGEMDVQNQQFQKQKNMEVQSRQQGHRTYNSSGQNFGRKSFKVGNKNVADDPHKMDSIDSHMQNLEVLGKDNEKAKDFSQRMRYGSNVF